MNKFFLIRILVFISGLDLQNIVLSETHNFREDFQTFKLIKGNSTFVIEAQGQEDLMATAGLKNSVTLHKSTTLLAGNNCSNFEPYDCKKWKCQGDSSEATSYNYFYSETTGYLIETGLCLGQDWCLNTETIYATNCSVNGIPLNGDGTSGIIGLGIVGKARKNYKTLNPVVSMSFINDTYGELSFSKNLEKTNSENPNLVLFVDDNWRVLGGQGIGVGERIADSDSFLIIFDHNDPTIGLPSEKYNNTIALLHRLVAMKCPMNDTKDLYQPICTYHGELKNLPVISLLIQHKKIIISPWQYVKDPEKFDREKGELQLNLRALSKFSQNPKSYVDTYYAGHVILGMAFLKRHHLVFTAAENNNTLGIFDIAESDPSDEKYILWILGVIIPVLCLIIWIFTKFRRNTLKDRKIQVQVDEGPISKDLTQIKKDEANLKAPLIEEERPQIPQVLKADKSSLERYMVKGRLNLKESRKGEVLDSEISNSDREMVEDRMNLKEILIEEEEKSNLKVLNSDISSSGRFLAESRTNLKEPLIGEEEEQSISKVLNSEMSSSGRNMVEGILHSIQNQPPNTCQSS